MKRICDSAKNCDTRRAGNCNHSVAHDRLETCYLIQFCEYKMGQNKRVACVDIKPIDVKEEL